MIEISTISNFRERIEVLKKVKRGVYANVENEIRKEFCDVLKKTRRLLALIIGLILTNKKEDK